MDGHDIQLQSTSVERTSEQASPVTALDRSYSVSRDVLAYEVSMAMDETPLALHIVARLRRDA